MTGRPLTHLGCDVRLLGRTAEGRAVFAYLDRHGEPCGRYGRALPHELRGIGWHIAAVKAAIAALPLEGAPQSVPATPGAPTPGRLSAHFSIPEGDR